MIFFLIKDIEVKAVTRQIDMLESPMRFSQYRNVADVENFKRRNYILILY